MSFPKRWPFSSLSLSELSSFAHTNRRSASMAMSSDCGCSPAWRRTASSTPATDWTAVWPGCREISSNNRLSPKTSPAGFDFEDFEWLDEVIIAADLESLGFVFHLFERAQE